MSIDFALKESDQIGIAEEESTKIGKEEDTPFNPQNIGIETLTSLSDIYYETAEQTRKKAVHYAANENAKSNGQSPLDIKNILERSLKSAQSLAGTLKMYNTIGFNIKDIKNPKIDLEEDAFDLPEINQIPEEDKIKAVKANLRGLAGEILSKPIELFGSCKTFRSEEFDRKSLENVVPKDVEEYSEKQKGRKDLLVINYFFNRESTKNEYQKEGKESGRLTQDQMDLVQEVVTDVLINYKKFEKNLREENPDKIPSPQVLAMEELKKRPEFIGNEKRKQSTMNRLAEEALVFGKQTGQNKLEKQMLSDLKDGHTQNDFYSYEELYNKATLPDQLLINEDGKVAGVIEVKSYTPDEFLAWLGQLQLDIKIEKTEEKVEEFKKHVLKAAGLHRRSLQTFITTKEGDNTSGIRLGVNVEGLRTAVALLNGEAVLFEDQKLDTIDPKTFEVHTQTGTPKYPIIIRVPNDILDEHIEKMLKIIGQLGYTNIAFQKLPFSSKEIDLLGQAYVKEYVHNSKFTRKHGFTGYTELEKHEQNILKKIADKDLIKEAEDDAKRLNILLNGQEYFSRESDGEKDTITNL